MFTQNRSNRSHLIIPVRDGSIKQKKQTPKHSNHPMLKHPIESPNSGNISKKNTYHLINLSKKNTQQFHLRNWKKSPNKFIQGTETHMLQQILRLRFQLSLTTLQQALSHLFEGFFLQLVRVDPQRVRHHGITGRARFFRLTSPNKTSILTLLYFGGFKNSTQLKNMAASQIGFHEPPKF